MQGVPSDCERINRAEGAPVVVCKMIGANNWANIA